MNPTVLFLLNVLEAVPSLITAGQGVAKLLTDTTAAVRKMQAENRDPSAEEWAAQAATISTLRAQLHAG